MNDSRLLTINVGVYKYTTTDNAGVHDKTYTLSVTRKAGVLSQTGEEFFQTPSNKKYKNTITYLFRLPVDINPRDQLRIGSRVLEVVSTVNVDNKNKWLHVIATEVT